jgi:DNA-directed RNA polymerase specialized sigma24 family protein
MKDLIYSFYKRYRRFKIELDDLKQEAELLQLQGKDISKGLEDYCYRWRSDRCSSAVPLQEWHKVTDVAEIPELSPKAKIILGKVRQQLTPTEFQVWSSIVLLAMKQCDVADELGMSQGEVSKILARARGKVSQIGESVLNSEYENQKTAL